MEKLTSKEREICDLVLASMGLFTIYHLCIPKISPETPFTYVYIGKDTLYPLKARVNLLLSKIRKQLQSSTLVQTKLYIKEILTTLS